MCNHYRHYVILILGNYGGWEGLVDKAVMYQ